VLELRVTNIDFDKVRITDENGETQTYDINKELAVDPFNVRDEFLHQSSKYSYWASLLEQLKLYEESYELQADKKRSELYEPSRQKLLAEGVTRPSKDQIDSQIMLDGDYYNLCNNVVAIHYQVNQIKALVKAFEQRKDMLIQYGADQRKEYEYSKKLNMSNQMP